MSLSIGRKVSQRKPAHRRVIRSGAHALPLFRSGALVWMEMNLAIGRIVRLYYHPSMKDKTQPHDKAKSAMNVRETKQVPIALMDAHKSDVRTQFAALCFRMVKEKPEILLITSRRSGRWIIPKGWPIDGETPAQVALTEAWEEAGVRGKVHERCLGLYSYHKMLGPERGVPCVAMVYAVRVKSLVASFPEASQRKRKWLRPKKAAALVSEPELAHIILNFHPRLLKH